MSFNLVRRVLLMAAMHTTIASANGAIDSENLSRHNYINAPSAIFAYERKIDLPKTNTREFDANHSLAFRGNAKSLMVNSGINLKLKNAQICADTTTLVDEDSRVYIEPRVRLGYAISPTTKVELGYNTKLSSMGSVSKPPKFAVSMS